MVFCSKIAKRERSSCKFRGKTGLIKAKDSEERF